MPQITDGSVTVTNGSANVISTLNNLADDWSLIVAGNIFTINASGVPYFVASTVAPNVSASGFWEINLSAPYADVDAVGLGYALVTDFTAYLALPLLKRGDSESALIFSRAMALIDSGFSTLSDFFLATIPAARLHDLPVTLTGAASTAFSITGSLTLNSSTGIVLTNSQNGGNSTVAVKSTSNNTPSAIEFQNFAGVAKMNIGYGNTVGSTNRTNFPYIEFTGGAMRLLDADNTKFWTLGVDATNGMTVNELVITVPSGQADNVLSLKQGSSTVGRIAGLTFRQSDNHERAALGIGESTGTYPFSGVYFMEASTIFGVTGPTTAPDIAWIQTHRNGANAIEYNQRIVSKDGGIFALYKNGVWPANIPFLSLNAGGTFLYLQENAGQVIVGPPNLSFPPNAVINLQVTRGGNVPVLFQILQDNIGGFNIGYATANSVDITFGSDSSSYNISFRKGIASNGTGGTEMLGLAASTNRATFAGPVKLAGYTVGTLPTGSVGDTAYVTNANAPTFNATVAAGGAVFVPVIYNGTNWICN